MKYILFYSEYCKYSSELLNQIKDVSVKSDIIFVCIDKRKEENGAMYSILDNGNKIIIPSCITEVPSVILLNRGNNIIKGPAIINYFNEEIIKSISQENNNNMEPSCYSLSEMGGLSDPYSYLDIPSEELLAKGGGGLRIMHDYCTIENNSVIETPTDDSTPSDYKLSTIDIDSIKKDRESQIPKVERII